MIILAIDSFPGMRHVVLIPASFLPLRIPELDVSQTGSNENLEVLVLETHHPVPCGAYLISGLATRSPHLVLLLQTPGCFGYALTTISRFGLASSFRHTFAIVNTPSCYRCIYPRSSVGLCTILYCREWSVFFLGCYADRANTSPPLC